MKELKADIDLLKNTIQRFEEVIQKNSTLNELIVSEHLLSLPENKETKEECKKLMDQIMDLARKTRIGCGDEPDIFLKDLSVLQNDSNDRFFEWLFDYMESAYKPYSTAALVRDMDIEKFKRATDFCFHNYILQVLSPEEIKEEWENKAEIVALKGIINTYIKLVVWQNYSKRYASEKIEDYFGLEKEYSDVIYQYVIGNEDRLWRRLLSKHINYIEESLDELGEE